MAQSPDMFGELKAEIVGVRARVELVTWMFGVGVVATIAISAVFRYVG